MREFQLASADYEARRETSIRSSVVPEFVENSADAIVMPKGMMAAAE